MAAGLGDEIQISGGADMTDAKTLNHAGPGQSAKPQSVGWVRWLICALPFAAIVLIYMHRTVVGVLYKPTFVDEFGWTDLDWAHIGMSFTLAYAIGQAGAGALLDKIGIRKGFMIAVFCWSVVGAAHGLLKYLPMNSALAHAAPVLKVGGLSVLGFCVARLGLGIFEGAFFPASIKIVADWFPKHDRALATGIFNAGSNVGAIIAPLTVPWIAQNWGWPVAFYLVGLLGLVWFLAWTLIYREPEHHPLLSAEELAYIRSDQDPPVRKMKWSHVLRYRQTWSFLVGKFMTDPVWWLYLTWAPAFLYDRFHIDLKHFGPPLVVIYVMADGGSIAGGWLSSRLIRKHGHSINRGRKTAMFICAICVTPIVAAAIVPSFWAATLLIGLAAAAHQGWSANLFTMASDTAPRAAISSIVGLGGMTGAIGALLFIEFIGKRLTASHGNYLLPFSIAAMAYLVALLIIQLLNPRLEMMRIHDEQMPVVTS
jgi:ACS family hexuronate transporter-like MFS transporter